MKIKIVLVAAILLSIDVFGQERVLKVWNLSTSRIEQKIVGEDKWKYLKKGTVLSQKDSLRFPSHSWIQISDSYSGKVYEGYKTNQPTCTSVKDVLKSQRRSFMDMLVKAIQVLIKNVENYTSCTQQFEVAGIQPLSANASVERDFAHFIRLNYSGRHRCDSLYMKKHMLDKSRFRIEIINNTDDTYYINVVRVDKSGAVNVCLDCRESSKEVLLFVSPKSKIPEDSIPTTFLKDRDSRYYLIASKEKFSWSALQDYLSQNEQSTSDSVDYSGFKISEAR